MNAQMFLEYTKRYEQILSGFPDDARRTRMDSDGNLPNENEELTLAVLRYFNLCSEEFYLYKNGYLSRKVWDIWEAELKRTLRSPLFSREWGTLRDEFQTYRAFQDYVDAEQPNGRE